MNQASKIMQEGLPTGINEKYQIHQLVGSGGMGSVYRATHIELQRTVAIKVLSSATATAEVRQRFKREALALSKLEHANIVRFLSFEEFNDKCYLVMEYVRGTSLYEYVQVRGKLSLEQSMKLVSQICDGLAFAHAADLVHRDIKPSNILLVESGTELTAKIVDFGLAKFADGGQTITTTGAAVGTALYMSPEQCTGQRVDKRADIYSTGGVLFYCLSGEPPYSGEQSLLIMKKHLTALPPMLSQPVPDSVNDIVWKALSKNASQRYQSAADLKSDLIAVLNNEPSVQASGTVLQTKLQLEEKGRLFDGAAGVEGPPPKNKNQRLIAAVAGLASLTLIAATIGLSVRNRPDKEAQIQFDLPQTRTQSIKQLGASKMKTEILFEKAGRMQDAHQAGVAEVYQHAIQSAREEENPALLVRSLLGFINTAPAEEHSRAADYLRQAERLVANDKSNKIGYELKHLFYLTEGYFSDDTEQAEGSFKKAIEVASMNSKLQDRGYEALSGLYYRRKDYRKALEIAERLLLPGGDKDTVGQRLVICADAAYHLKQTDKFNQFIKRYLDNRPYKRSAGGQLNWLLNEMLKENDLVEARKLTQHVEDVFRGTGPGRAHGESLLLIAKLDLAQNKLLLAQDHLRSAERMLKGTVAGANCVYFEDKSLQDDIALLHQKLSQHSSAKENDKQRH